MSPCLHTELVAPNNTNETNVPRGAEDEIDTSRRGVYLTDETWRAAKYQAALQGTSTSKFIEAAVLEKIKAA